MQEKTISIILAGGAGSRLYPLTAERAKPAVPFGGRYRIIDFTEIVNCMLASGTLIIGATVRHVILFPSVRVEEGAARDGERFTVSDRGIVVVARRDRLSEDAGLR